MSEFNRRMRRWLYVMAVGNVLSFAGQVMQVVTATNAGARIAFISAAAIHAVCVVLCVMVVRVTRRAD